jgi:hypothetical protein
LLCVALKHRIDYRKIIAQESMRGNAIQLSGWA